MAAVVVAAAGTDAEPSELHTLTQQCFEPSDAQHTLDEEASDSQHTLLDKEASDAQHTLDEEASDAQHTLLDKEASDAQHTLDKEASDAQHTLLDKQASDAQALVDTATVPIPVHSSVLEGSLSVCLSLPETCSIQNQSLPVDPFFHYSMCLCGRISSGC